MDNKSTLYFVWNIIFTSEVKKYKTKLKVQGNGGTLLVKRMSKISRYNQTTWFIKKSITNIFSLKSMTKHYIVTYNRNDETFSMQREESGLPNM